MDERQASPLLGYAVFFRLQCKKVDAKNEGRENIPENFIVKRVNQAAAKFLALKHESRILGHSSNPLCSFSMMEQVRLCAVWPMENWHGSSLNQIQG